MRWAFLFVLAVHQAAQLIGRSGALCVPLGLAYGRARIEWEAYTETLRAVRDLRGEEALRSSALKSRIVSQFTSAAYGWMWPFKAQVEAWYDAAVRQIEAEGADRTP